MRPHSQLDANAPRWRTVIGYGTAASVWIVSTDLLAHEYAPGSFLQLELFSDFTPARLNLARLLNELGRNPDAEHVLRDGIARVADEGELHYSLGLLLGEEERLPEAAAALGRAADLMPAPGAIQRGARAPAPREARRRGGGVREGPEHRSGRPRRRIRARRPLRAAERLVARAGRGGEAHRAVPRQPGGAGADRPHPAADSRVARPGRGSS